MARSASRSFGGKRGTIIEVDPFKRKQPRIKVDEDWKQEDSPQSRICQRERMDDDYQEFFGWRPNET